MADVSGPVSSLPGQQHSVPEGAMCDEHPDRPAVVRVQGETDSFGAEYIDGCAECRDRWAAEKKELQGGAWLGHCERCGASNVPMFPWRDYDEGMSGPVYYNCRTCKTEIVSAMNDEALAEQEYYAAFDDSYFEDSQADLEEDEPAGPIYWVVKFCKSRDFARSRRGDVVLYDTARAAENFVRRHKGKLRGQRITYTIF